MFEVAHEARLVNRHHRTEPHRDGRELPEIRHQPRVWIGRQPAAADFLAKAIELFFAEPAFEISARVDARCRVTLHEHHVTAMRIRRSAPEMIEAHFIQRGRRRVG